MQPHHFPLKYHGLLIHQEYDDEGIIEVVQHNTRYNLHFGSAAIQSTIDLSKPTDLQLGYTKKMMLALGLTQVQRVLFIGLGGGAMVSFLHHHFPEVDIDVIEKRAAVIDIAKEFFALPLSHRIEIHHGDAFHQLAELPHQYDIIFTDAFHGEGADITLQTSQFISDCKSHLSPSGVLAINLWSRHTAQLVDVLTLLRDQFNNRLAILDDPHQQNIVAFAYSQDNQHTQNEFTSSLPKLYSLLGATSEHAKTALIWRPNWFLLKLKLQQFFEG